MKFPRSDAAKFRRVIQFAVRPARHSGRGRPGKTAIPWAARGGTGGKPPTANYLRKPSLRVTSE